MNYYEILEVSQNASPEVVKAAYRSLMQRYHPDRNPDNPAIAERASQIIQAYEVISDVSMRAAYDIEHNLHETKIIYGRTAIEQAAHLLRYKHAPSGKTSASIVWIIILSIVISGWLILSLSKRNQSLQTETQSIQSSLNIKLSLNNKSEGRFVHKDEIISSDADLLKTDADKRKSDSASRVITDLISDFTINIGAANNLHRVLSIPALSARVGTFESEKVIKYMEVNKQLIVAKIADKLASAKYEEFIKPDGEQYLKKIILDSIDETAGTDRFNEFPASGDENPGRYGVVDIILPNSFSVR